MTIPTRRSHFSPSLTSSDKILSRVRGRDNLRIPVTILGATGVVGQRFVERIARHPSFEIAHLTASDRSAGKSYAQSAAWRLTSTPYGGFEQIILKASDPQAAFSPVVFSALDTAPAKEIEPSFAQAGALVFSNASAFRMAEDVPLLIPEVNPSHLELLAAQRTRRGWKGGIVCNANCTATVLAMALAPLHEKFGVEAVMMTSMQAVSGAGYPGVPSLDIIGNVIPYISSEEEKIQDEIPKMLGTFDQTSIKRAGMAVSALCHRVPVLDGHTEAVSVKLGGNPSPELVARAFTEWSPEPQRLKLPSAPAIPIRVYQQENRPQPRLDVEHDDGMSIHVGRIRVCPILGIKFTVLGHNTHRGAAGGSVLNAELAHARGLI